MARFKTHKLGPKFKRGSFKKKTMQRFWAHVFSCKRQKKRGIQTLKLSTDALAQHAVSGQSFGMPVPSQNPGNDYTPAQLVTGTFSVCQLEDCSEKALYGCNTRGNFSV